MLKPKTVDGVLATMNKTLRRLNGIATHRAAQADSNEAQAARLQAEAQAHRDEAEKARRVAEKIGGLIS